MGALCTQLGLPANSGIPAYEDPGYYALVEQKLPLNVEPEENKLQDPAERARIVRVFEQGLDKPASYVLPVQVWQSPDLGRRWVTERWGTQARQAVSHTGRCPRRIPASHRLASPRFRPSTIRTSSRAIRSVRRRRCRSDPCSSSSARR